jgi:hypothetical protein
MVRPSAFAALSRGAGVMSIGTAKRSRNLNLGVQQARFSAILEEGAGPSPPTTLRTRSAVFFAPSSSD